VTLPVAVARSLLFVPGDRPDRFAKAHASGADAVILDLEDGVDPAAREVARAHVREHLDGSAPALVRLSAADGRGLAADLSAVAARPGLAGVVVPKAEDAGAVRRIVDALPDGTAVVLLVETAAGLLAAEALARVRGVTRLALGTVDLAADAGFSRDADVLWVVRIGLTLASRAAGLPGPVDGPSTDLVDLSRTAVESQDAARTGFTGKLCIHPRQVTEVNDAFSPTPEAVDRARRIVDAAQASGSGAFRLDGEMIDAPVIARARSVLAAARTFSPAPGTPQPRSV
jgi:citrate lyase subunit beta/citryl-CoA lyase